MVIEEKGSEAAWAVRKLESVFPLTQEERQALTELPIQIAELPADQDIVREGDRPTRCCMVLSGVTCNYKLAADGKRQVLAFHIPGDIPDLQSLHLPVMDNSLGTISACRVGFIRHEDLRSLCHQYPRITDAFWRETLIDAAMYREWLLNLGRRQAESRIAHFLCEMVVRMQAVGLGQGNSFPFPITQVQIGDAQGLSNVHVNRSIMALRRAGLIVLTRDRLQVGDWEGLKRMAQFDPTYLHLKQTA